VQRPLSTVIVFGMACDTFLTMVALSVLYLLLGKRPLAAAKYDERPVGSRLTTANVAYARRLRLLRQSFRTEFGGLFLVLPMRALIRRCSRMHPDSVDDDATGVWTRSPPAVIIEMQRFGP
jgi:hypothetical protein